mgnify:CR=1 FL=1
MNILVLDVAASESGALSILEQYYQQFRSDTENQYYLCVSTPEMENSGNVQVLRFPWVKKTWFHRLWFECAVVPELVRKHHIDRVFSLQNLILSDPACEKWIYLHMSIPFEDLAFSLVKDPLMWVYRNIIGKLIYHSLKKADRVIVQTSWMKEACIQNAGLVPEKIVLQPPEICVNDVVLCADQKAVRNRLFYPATPLKYKNHMFVLRVLKRLKEQDCLGSLTLDLTLTGEENSLSRKVAAFAHENGLPVNFLGRLPRAQVMERYANSSLIFPSYIETFGLPLLEARFSNTVVLASDRPFSREILSGYPAALFFDPFDEAALFEILKHIAEKKEYEL